MAKVQFNCRLESEVAQWIDDESKRRSVKGKKFSQADVITMLVGSAVFTDDPETEQFADALRETVPNGASALIERVFSEGVKNWRASRKPLPKPGDKK